MAYREDVAGQINRACPRKLAFPLRALEAPGERRFERMAFFGERVHTAKDSPIGPAKPFAYNASKSALSGFTVHLADALVGTGIKVNSVHPGWVKTELGGQNAPEEIEGSGRTSVRLATLGNDGPTGGFFHLDATLPW